MNGHPAPDPKSTDPLRFIQSLPAEEVRREWWTNGEALRKARWVCAFTGVWAVISGYAVFLLWWESQHTHQAGKFLFALLAAVGAVSVIEWLRDLVREGGSEGHGHALAPRIMLTFVTLAVFEVFVMAWHGVTEFVGPSHEAHEKLLEFHREVLGPSLRGTEGALRDLITLATLWLVVAAALGWALAGAVFGAQGSGTKPLRDGLKAGVRAGIIAAPAAVLCFIVVIRFVQAGHLMLTDHAEWEAHLNYLVEQAPDASNGMARIYEMAPLVSAVALDKLWDLGWLGRAAALALVGAAFLLGKKRQEWRPFGAIAIGIAVAILAPLARDVGTLLLLAALAAVVWGFPGLTLGLFAPLLDQPSSKPKVWVVVSVLAACLLGVVTWLHLVDPKFLIASAVLLAASVAFQAGIQIEEYWPLLALSLASLVSVGMLALQETNITATFHGVLAKVHELNTLPASIAAHVIKIPHDYELRREYKSHAWDSLSNQIARLQSKPLFEQIAGLRLNLDHLDQLNREAVERLSSNRLAELHRRLDADAKRQALPAANESSSKFKLPWSSPAQTPKGNDPAAAPFRLPPVPEPDAVRDLSTTQVLHSVQVEFDEVLSRFTDPRLAPLDLQSLSQYASRLSTVSGALLSSERVRADLLAVLEVKERQAEHAAHEAEEEKAKAKEVHEWLEERVPQRLELSIVGSLAFWITVALLAAWPIRRHSLLSESHPDGLARCFWAKDDLAYYHDKVHGTKPQSDRELFERLALALLDGDVHPSRGELLRAALSGFDPERLSTLDPKTPIDGVAPDRIALLIENAKRFCAYQNDPRAAPSTPAGLVPLLQEWEHKAAAGPEVLIAHVRGFFEIPRKMKVATFLQSVGLLPGAHFYGCHRAPAPGGSHRGHGHG